MQVTEEQYVFQVELLSRTLELISEKFRIIGKTEEDTKQFAKISDVQKAAMAETNTMRGRRRRHMERCRNDLAALEKAVAKADAEDLDSAREFAKMKKESDERLKGNLDKQDSCWNRIQALQADLQNLAAQRMEEVKKRVNDIEREADRHTTYDVRPVPRDG
mgnify:CR=1 FL=1